MSGTLIIHINKIFYICNAIVFIIDSDQIGQIKEETMTLKKI